MAPHHDTAPLGGAGKRTAGPGESDNNVEFCHRRNIDVAM